MKLQNLKIASALTAFTLGVVSNIGLLSQPAYAHKDCYKQSLGFPGSWTWVCKPHVHSPSASSGSSCLSFVTPPTKYRLVNRTRNFVYYSLNGRSYRLSPRYRRTHHVGGGSNGCNVASNRAVVTFDYNTRKPGRQEATYTLNRGGLSKGYEYYFHSGKNSAYLQLITRNLKTPLRVQGRKETIHLNKEEDNYHYEW